jgi:hypothetical protein
VADKLGIDLIWFGVLLCVNMQTSFMHPPFGFALFYLRGISDTLFKNKVLPRKVESRDIYLGAIPWVCMQLLLVAIVIFVPETVTMFIDKPPVLDLEKADEQLLQMGGREAETPAAEAASAPAAATAASAADPLAPAPADAPIDPVKAMEEAARKR